MAVHENSLFGAAGDFMTVRALEIRGTNFEIGQAIGRLAIDRYGLTRADFACDPLFGRARRAYMEAHFPIHWQRMRGVADALGHDVEDDGFDLTGISYLWGLPVPPPACSAIYYPPGVTTTGTGFLSRNYDFSIGLLADLMRVPLPVEARASLRPVMSEPYVMKWYPSDGGYATLAVHAFDLLSGTLEGINSAGLAVSILADHTAINELGPNLEPHSGRAQVVGLHELAVMRLLLDTCQTARQARQALLGVKQYYSFAPLHYIVADRSGDSFVYEQSTGRNVQYVIDGGGRPQVLTNYQIHKYAAPVVPNLEALNVENETFWRQQRLLDRVAEHSGAFAPADMKAANACVSIREIMNLTTPGHPLRSVPSRTVWHSLYDQAANRVEISFYLGEAVAPGGRYEERRSDYVSFELGER